MQLASGGDATGATPVADEELKKKIALYYHGLVRFLKLMIFLVLRVTCIMVCAVITEKLH